MIEEELFDWSGGRFLALRVGIDEKRQKGNSKKRSCVYVSLNYFCIKKKKKSESSFYQSIAMGKGPEKESIRYILLIGL